MPGPWNPDRNAYNLKQANLAYGATRKGSKSNIFQLRGNAARFAQHMKPEEIYAWVRETAKLLKENK